MKTMFDDLLEKYPDLSIRNGRPKHVICPYHLGYEEQLDLEICGNLLCSECWARLMEEKCLKKS